MRQEDMIPKLDLQSYVPPLMQPEYLVEPLMNNLIQRSERAKRSTQDMMAGMVQQSNTTLINMWRPNAMTFLPNG